MINSAVRRCPTPAAPHHGDVTSREHLQHFSHPQFGTTAALNSPIDLLLIQVIRTRLDARAEKRVSWLSGLLDPPVRDALTKIHQEPSRPWTTATLAAAISVYRATLSRRFPAATEQTPGDYLTR
ncbi:hypothetical protein [Streptomyces sp. NPDC093984]|uniref:hypothetical protein n=1 Tax=Streptomyces sp. NPDC093984 TaxID=3366052 RepID=UPI003806E1B7